MGSDAIDTYVPARLLEGLQREHALARMSGPECNVILRAVLGSRRFAPLAAVAIDLCTYADPRAARVGADALASIDRDSKAA